jgi:hypothetical protein
VRGDGVFDVLGQVVPQVPAVGDLHGVRCAVAGGLRVGAGSVPAHDLDFRMAS